MKESCPFQIGKKYHIRRGCSCLNPVFRQGEDVVFSSHAYSPQEGVTRYWFRCIQSGETNIWHLADGDLADGWSEVFEAIDGA